VDDNISRLKCGAVFIANLLQTFVGERLL